MFRKEYPLPIFRAVFFPLLIITELALSILFLLMDFYHLRTDSFLTGYRVPFAWLMASCGFLLVIGTIILVLTMFSFTKEKIPFLTSGKQLRFFSFGLVFLIYLQIVFLAITKLLYSFIFNGGSLLDLLIIILSLYAALLFYFIANVDTTTTIPYALTKGVPLRIQFSSFWLLFLSGVVLIFSNLWEFFIVAGLVLFSSLTFYLFYRFSVMIAPLLLIIHSAFSAIIAIVSLLNVNATVQNLQEMGLNFTRGQSIAISVAFFIIPGSISLLLGQSLFRKNIIQWIRDVRPKPELQISLLYQEEQEEAKEQGEKKKKEKGKEIEFS
jgi:hypothetical protein